MRFVVIDGLGGVEVSGCSIGPRYIGVAELASEVGEAGSHVVDGHEVADEDALMPSLARFRCLLLILGYHR